MALRENECGEFRLTARAITSILPQPSPILQPSRTRIVMRKAATTFAVACSLALLVPTRCAGPRPMPPVRSPRPGA